MLLQGNQFSTPKRSKSYILFPSPAGSEHVSTVTASNAHLTLISHLLQLEASKQSSDTPGEGVGIDTTSEKTGQTSLMFTSCQLSDSHSCSHEGYADELELFPWSLRDLHIEAAISCEAQAPIYNQFAALASSTCWSVQCTTRQKPFPECRAEQSPWSA